MAEIKKSLLPQGFHDHLPPEAMGEVRLNSVVVNRLTSFGYELVRPAIMEFEESLDKDFSSDFFKVTDTLSGKMMVVRNDITPQIARIVRDRYGEEAFKKTIRLAYTGQVVRKLGKGKFTERQLTQAGYELVSDDDAKRDAEAIYIAIETYEKAGLKDFTVDFCYPRLAGILLKEKGFSQKEISEIIAKIEEKDIAELNGNEKLSEICKIIQVSDKVADLNSAIDALAMLEKETSSAEAKKIFAKTREIFSLLKNSGLNFKVSLNLLEIMGYSYHCGLCYSFISRKNYDEVGRGGRYKISIGKEKQLNAVGFTFLINAMLRSVDMEIKTDKKSVKYDEGFTSSKDLRDSGKITIFE